MITLNVNIDHISTIRNARGGVEPDPIYAAFIAEQAGATGIVTHLREDRRHIKDRDLYLLKETVQSKLDLEMAANEEIIQIALKVIPDLVTIVPEKRQELTTEGGLDIRKNRENLKKLCYLMHEKGIEVSLFIDPDEMQIEESILVGADMVELHTGTYANAKKEKDIIEQYKSLTEAALFAHNGGLSIAAGHGLNYFNTHLICKIPQIKELSIGHSIISRAAFTGLQVAVKDMLEIIQKNLK